MLVRIYSEGTLEQNHLMQTDFTSNEVSEDVTLSTGKYHKTPTQPTTKPRKMRVITTEINALLGMNSYKVQKYNINLAI